MHQHRLDIDKRNGGKQSCRRSAGLSLLAQGLFDRARNLGGTACGRIFEQAPDTDVPAAIADGPEAG